MEIIKVATKYLKPAWEFTKTAGITVAKTVKENKSMVATVTGILCSVASVPVTIKASFKAKEKLDAAKKEINRREKAEWDADPSHDNPYEERELTLKERIEVAGPDFIVPVALNAVGTGGIIAGKVWDRKEIAENKVQMAELAVAAAQTKELVDKAIPEAITEVVGEEKASEIEKKIEEKKEEMDIPSDVELDAVRTGLGNDLMYIKDFGFYIYASVSSVKLAWEETVKYFTRRSCDFAFADFLESLNVPDERIGTAAKMLTFKYGLDFGEGSDIAPSFYGDQNLKDGRKSAIVVTFDTDIYNDAHF